MKLIWHIYDRAEGKSTEALQEIDKDNDVLIVSSQQLVAEIKERNPKIQCFSNLDLRGLHPSKIIIDEPYRLVEIHPAIDLRKKIHELWAIYHCPIHLYCTIGWDWIMDILYNPLYANKKRVTENEAIDQLQQRLVEFTVQLSNDLGKLKKNIDFQEPIYNKEKREKEQ